MLPTDPTGPAPVHGVGPRPVGDPEGMRALASRLRQAAARLSRHESLDLHAWRSERARTVRGILEDYATTARRGSDELGGLAAELDIEADHVEALQLDWISRKAIADARHSSLPASKI